MSEPIDISPSQRKELLRLIQHHLPSVDVWAFGSRVKWTARSNSDLDLVVFAKAEDEARVSRLKEALEESSLPFRVDLLVWDSIPENFQKNISERYVVLVEATKSDQGRHLRSRPFKDIFAIPLRNGLTKPKAVRGVGTKMVNMGELFANPRIVNVAMDRVPLNQSERNSSLLAAGDLLFARQSLVLSGAGKCSIFVSDDEEVCFESHVIRCRLNRDLADPDFYFYFFCSPAGRKLIESIVEQGAGASGIRGSDLAELTVPWVEPEIQSRIATVLRNLDDKIASNRRINQTLEAMAQAIFKSWFVDFDPVKAKIAAIQEGRDPLCAAMRAISGKSDAELDALPPEQYEPLAATAALFPDVMEESELGAIPKGWSVARIQDVVEGVYDGPHATPPEATQGAVFLGIRNMTGTSLDMSDIRHIAEADWAHWTRRIEPRAGDIVFSYEATLGYFALLPSGLRCCLGRRLALIRPRVEQGFGSFWFHQFVAPPFQRFLEKHTIPGATVNRIALKDFPSFPVLKPATAIQSAFCERVDRIWSLIHANQAQSERLGKLRDTLLPKLLSGELSVTKVVAEAH